MDNDQAVRWTDDVSSSYIFVPNIDLKFRLIPAMLASGLGLMLGGWPIAVSAAFYLLMPPEAHQAEGFSMGLLAPIPFFGVILFPISGWLLARSILMLAGKTRLSIEDGVVHRRTSWGPLWSSKRCKIDDIQGFQAVDLSRERMDFSIDRANVTALLSGGRKITLLKGVSLDLARSLAAALPRKIERLTGRADFQGVGNPAAASLPSEVISDDPHQVGVREQLPVGSNLVLDQKGGSWAIEVPALGFKKVTNGYGAIIVTFMIVIQSILTFGLLPALLLDKVNGQPIAGWIILIVFTLINSGVGLLIYAASIRRGWIQISEREVICLEKTLWSEHRYEWPLSKLDQVEVGIEEHRSDGELSWTHFLKIEPRDAEGRKWFDHRTKEELEWIVSLILKRLNGKPHARD